MINTLWLLYGIGTIPVLVISLFLYAWIKQRHLQRRLIIVETQLNKLQQELRIVYNGTSGIDRRLDEIEQLFRHNVKQQKTRQQPLHHESHYQQANKMMDLGADLEEIVQCCKLSQGEVELLKALHGNKAL